MTYHKFLFTYRFNAHRLNTYLSLSLAHAHANSMQMPPLHTPRNGNEYEIIHIIAYHCIALLVGLLVWFPAGSLLNIFHY